MTAIAPLDQYPVAYDITDAAIEELRSNLTGLTANTTAEYERVRLGIAQCRDIRVRVEKTRKELNVDALAWQRRVNSEAKRITDDLLSIEEPLKLTKQAVDDEKARLKAEKEAAERAKIEAVIVAQRAAQEAEAARLKAERDAAEAAERERVRKEQEAEAAKLAAERAKLDAERDAANKWAAEQKQLLEAELAERRRADAEMQAAAQKKLDDDRAAVEAERLRLQEIENQRLIAEHAAREKARLDALRPDFEKLQAFADVLLTLDRPDVVTPEANAVVDAALRDLDAIAQRINDFAPRA